MRLRAKTLRVYPNPWGVHPSSLLAGPPVHHSTLDHEGRPCGVYAVDPIADGGEPGRLVGAKVCDEHTKMDAPRQRPPCPIPATGEIRSIRQRTVYSFMGHTGHETAQFELAEKLSKLEPITLPFSEYYKLGISEGSLIAADEATAKEARVSYAEPAVLFPALAKAAAWAFDQQYNGDAAYKHFVDARAKAAGVEVAPPPPVTAPKQVIDVPVPDTEPASPSAKRSRAVADATPSKENS